MNRWFFFFMETLLIPSVDSFVCGTDSCISKNHEIDFLLVFVNSQFIIKFI